MHVRETQFTLLDFRVKESQHSHSESTIAE